MKLVRSRRCRAKAPLRSAALVMLEQTVKRKGTCPLEVSSKAAGRYQEWILDVASRPVVEL